MIHALLSLLLAMPLAAQPSAQSPASSQADVDRCWREAIEDPAVALPFVETVLAREEGADSSTEEQVRAVALAELRLCRGYVHEQLGDLAPAGSDYEWAVGEGERLGNTKLLASALAQRGELAYYRGAFTAALGDLNRAHALELELGRKSRQLYVLNAIANVYADARVGGFDRAIEYYRQIQAAHAAAGREGELSTTHFNLGSTYERKGDFAGALVELERSLAIEQRRGDLDEVAFAERAVASVLVKLGRPREAIERLDRSLARFVATGNEEWIAHARLTRGIARRALGDSSGALADLDAARSRFAATGNDRFLVRVEEERAEALAGQGDHAAAFGARSQQLALERKLAESSRDEQTSRLRVEFETEQKERENVALLRENELRAQALSDAERIRDLQRWVLALAAALLAVLVVLALRQLARARRMQRLALTDELTRLPNRRAFFAHADEALARSRRTGEAFALLALDIDHFKRVNDTHGHETGDRVLQRVAGSARSALRAIDVVGRTGGEEFLAVLPGSSPAAAAEIAERLRRAVERLDVSDLAAGLTVSVSIGVATEDSAASPRASAPVLEDIVRRADEALYRAKARGRNRVEIDPDPSPEPSGNIAAAPPPPPADEFSSLPETEIESDVDETRGAGTPARGLAARGKRLAPGDRIGRYEVVGLLGRGGMGAVYTAFDPQLDRKVAVKVLASASSVVGSARARASKRLLREAQALARLQHPNVVAVHDVGTFGEDVFVAMELLDGETLDRHLAHGAPEWREVVRLYLEAGRGLVAAHGAGLVHRDFKPSNVLVCRDGRVCVLDFGLARSTARAADLESSLGSDETDHSEAPQRRLLDVALTRAGARAGTLGYMAPEQLTGETVDARSDQFSFCAALYEALCDNRPAFVTRRENAAVVFETGSGSAHDAYLAAIRAGALCPPPESTPVPAAVFALLARGLAARPEDRHPELASLLDQIAVLSLRRRAADREPKPPVP